MGANRNISARPVSRPFTTVEDVVRVAYERHRIYCRAIGDEKPPWDMLDPSARERYLMTAFFLTDDPQATPERLHGRWCEEMLERGWTRGDKLDEEARIHPHLRSDASLDPALRTKARLWIEDLRRLLTLLPPSESHAAGCAVNYITINQFG